ncbi:DUF4082 domain-containing protein [Rhodovulum sp. DZ06]|uniref:DUF4082 domain-containing protein n=1 Tax=Rhodovulum sp. DZ06 TaxID=3425126 RepID=UPI003D32E0E8
MNFFVKLSAAAAVATVAFAPLQAGAVTYALDGAAPSSIGPDALNYQLGWEFIANQDLSVVEMGFYSEAARTRTVTLWDIGGAVLGSVDVTATGAGWFYGTLSSPIALTAGSSHVASYSYLNGDHVYGLNAPVTAPEVSYVQARWGVNNAFPTNLQGSFAYPADIGFEAAPSADVPLPAAAPLAVLGMAALGFAARRRKG